ncbi:hypothetical protein [Nocardia camponoti]|uniref:Uncharacterized protein n=1 Tax=Nocardia camponoti TaxID=1616106 RepID=A0A917VDU9_9NOCA|nr:hypothetical protein [Nocardia camponoti]GGK65889.1 hypothetical protein GCM10011591_42560 [Nocardia camponoti]
MRADFTPTYRLRGACLATHRELRATVEIRVRDPCTFEWCKRACGPGFTRADPVPAWEGDSDAIFRTINDYFRAGAPNRQTH